VVESYTPLVVDDYTPKKEKRNKRIKDIKIYIREIQLHIQSMHKHSYKKRVYLLFMKTLKEDEKNAGIY